MKAKWVARRVGMGIVIGIVAATVLGFVVMLLWNALVPDLFHGPVLTFWQAVGLFVLLHILFHGKGRGFRSHDFRHHLGRHRIEERLASMTPEERERFKKEWGWHAHRCCGEEERREQTPAAQS